MDQQGDNGDQQQGGGFLNKLEGEFGNNQQQQQQQGGDYGNNQQGNNSNNSGGGGFMSELEGGAKQSAEVGNKQIFSPQR